MRLKRMDRFRKSIDIWGRVNMSQTKSGQEGMWQMQCLEKRWLEFYITDERLQAIDSRSAVIFLNKKNKKITCGHIISPCLLDSGVSFRLAVDLAITPVRVMHLFFL